MKNYFLLAILGFCVISGIASIEAQASDPRRTINTANSDRIYACYHKQDRQLRKVDGPAQCKKRETEISWNITGPPGPQGLPGNDGADGGYDKQLRFEVFGGVGSQLSGGFTHDGGLIKFKKTNYSGVYSLVFFVHNARTSDSNSRIFFELYDLTNGVVVTGSEVSTNSTQEVDLESGNLFDSLPDQEISLGLRIRTEVDGILGDADASWIFLFRD